MLFFCYWAKQWSSVVVDADDLAAATAAAAGHVGGEAPSLVTPLRERGSAFVFAEIVFDADEEGEPDSQDVVTVEPPDDVFDLLVRLQDAGDAATAEDADVDLVAGICGDAIQEREGGPTLVCTLDEGHEGDHEGKAPGGEIVAWPQETQPRQEA